MVRKRGPLDRIEKVVSKKRSINHTEETTNESSNKKAKNILNDHILSLYKKETSLHGESSLSTNHSLLDEAEKSVGDVKNKETNTKNDTTLSKASRISTKLEKKKNSGVLIKHPTITFKDVAGLDEVVEKIFRLYYQLRYPEVFSALNLKKCINILLHGPTGCGKTHIVHALAGETGLPLLEVKTNELVCGVSGESESKIRDIFEEALKNAPCILFFDKINVIAPKKNSSDSGGVEKRMITQLLASLEDFKEKDNSSNVMVIAATNQQDAIDPDVLNKFYYQFAVKIPDEKARLMILQVLTKDLNLPPDFDLEWLAHHTPGYVGVDLYHLVEKGCGVAVDRMFDKFIFKHLKVDKSGSDVNSSDQLKPSLDAVLSFSKSEYKIPIEEIKNTVFSLESFQEALKDIVPSSKREGFCMVPNVTWEDVGALKDIKEELQETIIWPVKYRKLFENSCLESTKGILLYGPKGCGKTLMAKAIANECSINFLSVKGPELLNMYLGESERAVRQCFQRARNSAPCVIFFDEMDALCPERTGSNANAAADRVVNMLLTEMDGMEERNQVFVIGATNRLEKMDSAMLRPGRLEKKIYITLPSPDDRVDILKSLTKNKTKPKISDEVDLNTIGRDSRCENFSGADLAYLIRAATAIAVKEHIKASTSMPTDTVEINLRHFEHVLNVVKPSVTEKDIKHFQRISEQSC